MGSRCLFVYVLAILLSLLRLAPGDNSTIITCSFQNSFCSYSSSGWKADGAHVAADTSGREHSASLRSATIQPTLGRFCFRFQFKASCASGANLYVHYEKYLWGINLSTTQEEWMDGSVMVRAASAASLAVQAEWEPGTHPLIYLRNVRFDPNPCPMTPYQSFVPAQEKPKVGSSVASAASLFQGCLYLILPLAVSATAFVKMFMK